MASGLLLPQSVSQGEAETCIKFMRADGPLAGIYSERYANTVKSTVEGQRNAAVITSFPTRGILDGVTAVIEANWGKLLMPQSLIPGVGGLIQIEDSEGNVACAMHYYSE
jgi:hypothetical protein